MVRIFFRGHVGASGYGDITRCLTLALSGLIVGQADLMNSLSVSQKFDWELYAIPLGYGDSPYPAKRKGAKAAIYTMWETDWITPQQQALLRRFDVVFVPSMWCQSVFASAGITSYVVHPFVETDIKATGSLVLAAGASHPPSRKRIDDTIALLESSGADHSVRSDDASYLKSKSAKLRIGLLSESEQWAWFTSGKLFLSLSRGEGWGLYQHAALAIGIPLVCTAYGGLADFVTDENSYIIPHTEIFADGYFSQGLGKWSDVDLKDAEDVLRFALSDPGFSKKQKAAAASVARFTRSAMRQQLLSVLSP